jgi:hypothetical protein
MNSTTRPGFTVLLGKLIEGSLFMMSSSDSSSLSSDIREVTPAKWKQVSLLADCRQTMVSLEPSVIGVKTVMFFFSSKSHGSCW